MIKSMLLATLLVSTPVLAQKKVSPANLPYVDFEKFCSTSEENAVNCMAFYEGIFSTLRIITSHEGVSNVLNSCPWAFDSKKYAAVKAFLLKEGYGEKMDAKNFLVMAYMLSTSCKVFENNNVTKTETHYDGLKV